jgi:outer membrane protein assembly factor BamD
MRVGDFYHKKGSLASSANRLTGMVDQYPLYSRADEALWLAGDSYGRMGPRFRPQAIDSYQKLVKDYPLSEYTDQAKQKLKSMEADIPESNASAMARMKYEKDNRTRLGVVRQATGFIRRGPDTSTSAKAGSPQMNPPRQNVPASVPVPGTTTTGFQGDVTATPVTGPSALDTQPDARSAPPAATGSKDGKAKGKK